MLNSGTKLSPREILPFFGADGTALVAQPLVAVRRIGC